MWTWWERMGFIFVFSRRKANWILEIYSWEFFFAGQCYVCACLCLCVRPLVSSIDCTKLYAYNCERRWAKLSVARSRESPSAVTYGNLQQTLTTHISVSIDFRHIVHGTKKSFFFMYRTHIRDEPARPDPARPGPTRPSRFWQLISHMC